MQFQPFLRFYFKMQMLPSVKLVAFQPFLRFYTLTERALNREANERSVSTLLEILLYVGIAGDDARYMSFQPFLRFYVCFMDARPRDTCRHGFQPFLRFYSPGIGR